MKNIEIKKRIREEMYEDIRHEKDLVLGEEIDFTQMLKMKKLVLCILFLLVVVINIQGSFKRSDTETLVDIDSTSTLEDVQQNDRSIDLDVTTEVEGPGIYGFEDEVLAIEVPEIVEDFVDINNYSRIGQLLDSVDKIVVHYVGNPGTTAAQNRSYYQELKLTQETKASSNYVVGLEGEIIEAVPRYEVAYASNGMNRTSISIETCHYTEAGNFTEDTLESLIHLCAWLCLKYDLQASDVIRHYDITGKNCPKYYVENQDEWDGFLQKIEDRMTYEEDRLNQ